MKIALAHLLVVGAIAAVASGKSLGSEAVSTVPAAGPPAIPLATIAGSLTQDLRLLESQARAAHAALLQPGSDGRAIASTRLPALAALAAKINSMAGDANRRLSSSSYVELRQAAYQLDMESAAIARQIEAAKAKVEQEQQAAWLSFFLGVASAAANVQSAAATLQKGASGASATPATPTKKSHQPPTQLN